MRDVVLATATATTDNGGERLLRLAGWLDRRGVTVEIIALGEGTRPELALFEAVAPTLIIDRFRRSGIARVPHLLGMRRITAGWKRLRLRHMMKRRRAATFVIFDPVAASLLRYAEHRPRRVIAAFPDSTWSMDRLRPEDRRTLADADGWITSDEEQTAHVSLHFDGPVLNLGDAAGTGALVDRAELPPVHRSSGAGGSVVLLGAIGLWNSVDHTAELAWLLHRAVPNAGVRWVVDSEADRWLAHHDLRHARLTDVVELRSSTERTVLDDVSVVVRTAYEPTYQDLALAAALGGAPVLGMCTSDVPGAPREAEPFAVDALVERIAHLIAEPDERERSGAELRSAVDHLDLDKYIESLTSLLLPGRA